MTNREKFEEALKLEILYPNNSIADLMIEFVKKHPTSEDLAAWLNKEYGTD